MAQLFHPLCKPVCMLRAVLACVHPITSVNQLVMKLEVDSVPMSHFHKTANLYKVHARQLVEDVLSFSGSEQKFGPAADHIELLTTGHDIAAGTIIGSFADASLKLMKEADETCRM
jgi:hypothetical protein